MLLKGKKSVSELTAGRSSQKAGLPPGSLIYVGVPRTEEVKVTLMEYSESHFHETEIKSAEECASLPNKKDRTWIHVNGLHDPEIIEALGSCYKLHPLILEDILNTGHRPKVEEHENCLFIVLKILSTNHESQKATVEQLSIVLGDDFVLSFQEGGEDISEPIKRRFHNGKGRIKTLGTDYLAYSLMDIVVDQYFITLEAIGEWIESFEEEMETDPSPETLHQIHRLKREILFLRKSVRPLRELVGRLERSDYPFIRESTHIYFRDLYDHTVQVFETIDTFWEMVSGLLQIYLSVMSNKMNEVMKVLTIIATLFIPLTFITSIYGMNFQYMPELHWRWGYLLIWCVILFVSLFMIAYFKRNKWF